MPLWSKERVLRSCLSPRHAVAILSLVSAVSFASGLAGPSSGGPTPGLAAASFGAGCLALAGYVDFVRRILPDPLLLCAAVAAGASALESGPSQAVRACAVASAAIGVAYAVAATTSLGRGDAKLCGAIGLWLGQPLQAGVAVLGGVGAAGAYALALAAAGRLNPGGALPLGPWLVGSAWWVWSVSGSGPAA